MKETIKIKDIKNMNRKIAFRAWDGKHMFYNVIVLDDSFYSWATPMQFTGLLDKQGKEIYEGDVFIEQRPGREYAYVYFDDEFSDFALGNHDGRIMGLAEVLTIYYEDKVIGNIYENPELLTNK